MSLYKINDVELDIDMEDYDFQVKYEKAFDQLEQDEKELQKIGRASEVTKSYCEMFNRLFDNIFGDGTSTKLFDGKYNMSKTEQVYSEFMAYRQDGTIQNTALTGDYEALFLQPGDNIITFSSGFTVSIIPRWRILL